MVQNKHKAVCNDFFNGRSDSIFKRHLIHLDWVLYFMTLFKMSDSNGSTISFFVQAVV